MHLYFKHTVIITSCEIYYRIGLKYPALFYVGTYVNNNLRFCAIHIGTYVPRTKKNVFKKILDLVKYYLLQKLLPF